MDSLLTIKILVLPILPPIAAAVLVYVMEVAMNLYDYLKMLSIKESERLSHTASSM